MLNPHSGPRHSLQRSQCGRWGTPSAWYRREPSLLAFCVSTWNSFWRELQLGIKEWLKEQGHELIVNTIFPLMMPNLNGTHQGLWWQRRPRKRLPKAPCRRTLDDLSAFSAWHHRTDHHPRLKFWLLLPSIPVILQGTSLKRLKTSNSASLLESDRITLISMLLLSIKSKF